MLALVGGVLRQEADHQFDVHRDFSDVDEAVGFVAVRIHVLVEKPFESHADDVLEGPSQRVAVRIHLAQHPVKPGSVFGFQGYYELKWTDIGPLVLDLGDALHSEIKC